LFEQRSKPGPYDRVATCDGDLYHGDPEV
jgi:hypothetical protein